MYFKYCDISSGLDGTGTVRVRWRVNKVRSGISDSYQGTFRYGHGYSQSGSAYKQCCNAYSQSGSAYKQCCNAYSQSGSAHKQCENGLFAEHSQNFNLFQK